MLAAATAAAALAAFTPVVIHDAAESSPLASATAAAPIARVAADRAPAAYGRAVPDGRGGTWLQYWLYYAYRTRTAGSSAPGATPATGNSSSTASQPPAARSRPSTRSTAAPSAAASTRSRFAAGIPSSTPPTARTRPISSPGRGTECGPTPTTRPTAAARSPPPARPDHRVQPRLDALPLAMGRITREPVHSHGAGLAAARLQPARGTLRAARKPGVGACDGRRDRRLGRPALCARVLAGPYLHSTVRSPESAWTRPARARRGDLLAEQSAAVALLDIGRPVAGARYRRRGAPAKT